MKRGETMTYYIETCTKEIMAGLGLDRGKHENDIMINKLLIEKVLHRNLDKLFKLLLEEQEKKNEL